MKILILQDHLRSGGTERQSVLLAHAFTAAGHATTLASFRPGGALDGTVVPPVARHIFQPFDTGLNWFAPGLGGFVRRLQPEVILCMGRMANCHVGRLQKLLPGTAVIATMRTGKKLPWLYRRSLRLARHIVANSHEAARGLAADHGIAADKITVIHNALVFPPDAEALGGAATTPREVGEARWGQPAPPDSEAPRPTFRAAHNATATTTVLLCVAMFRPEKNQRALVELAARLPRDLDWQLWLVGDGETRSECAALASKCGIADRMKFLGFQADPAPVYRAADVAVLTSRAESLPNFLIEAQAHGLPVVAEEVGGVRECFLPGETGWAVPPGDADAFLAALAPLLGDPARRAAAGRAARTFARDAFAPARQSQRYLDVFGRMVPTALPW